MTRLTLITNPDICNLKCPLCFLNQKGSSFGCGEMPWSIAKASIDKYLNGRPHFTKLREIIPSTMGEPLLYSKFDELLTYSKSLNIPINLTTNGTFVGFGKSDEEKLRLLYACNDIKISCMGFDNKSMQEMMPGCDFEKWLCNVMRLIALKNNDVKLSTISLQVTLHKKMIPFAKKILEWAESIGINRIKWNLPVFLEKGKLLSLSYGIEQDLVEKLRFLLKSKKIRTEGSLFFNEDFKEKRNIENVKCDFFKNEIWILPDGSEEFCPNPERRFGNINASGATCKNCVLFLR